MTRSSKSKRAAPVNDGRKPGILAPEHHADLAQSGISAATIKAAGINSPRPADIAKVLGWIPKGVLSAFEIPYSPEFSRLRCFYEEGFTGRKHRYLQRKDSGCRIYFPPLLEPSILTDASIPIFITEGEKKALKACQDGIPCLGLGGLWNFEKDGKLIEDFSVIEWLGRQVGVIPDNDFRQPKRHGYGRNLDRAVRGICDALAKLGAKVTIVLLPESETKIGLDDYLCGHSVDDFKSLPTISVDELPGQWLYDLNRRHAVVMLGGKCCIMNEVVDPTFGRPDITFSSPRDFGLLYQNVKVPVPDGNGNTRMVGVAKKWFEDPHRRFYQGVTFSPQGDVSDHYNLWRGFGIEPIRGEWSKLQHHMLKVLCRGDAEYFQYLYALMAYKVQHPGGERPGVAVVLRGGRGTGKGIFAREYGKLFGSHFLHIRHVKHLTGRFNSHMKNCLLLFVDEAFWAGDKEGESVLKGLITEPEIMVEYKGKDAFMVPNHVDIIIASNAEWAVPAALDERRFFVLDVSDEKAQNSVYFKSIVDEMENGGREAMLYDLLHSDVSGIDLRSVPQTDALFNQQLRSMTTLEEWWLDRLHDGEQLRDSTAFRPAPGEPREDWMQAVPTSLLHDEYIVFSHQHGNRRPLHKVVFSRDLRKLCKGISGPRRVTLDMRENGTKHEPAYVPGRPNCLIFQPLHECRDQFCEVIRRKIEWAATG